MRSSLFLLLIVSAGVMAQPQHKKAAFIGNSYTYSNNLPQLISNIAESVGDTLTYSSSTPGGFTLQGHTTNSQTLSLIAQTGWDYMVLQEQSQRPSFPDFQVQNDVYPYAHTLDTTFHSANPCGETVFFMTWGRENGDASNCAVWPPVCTYEGMDSLLALRYRIMADTNHALLSPVGALWNYLRDHHPTIDLYQSDESHPSYAGSYAAACAFYAIFFQKDPGMTYYDGQLNATTASTIRNAAKIVIYDSLFYWNVGRYYPKAEFDFSFLTPDSIQFENNSLWSEAYSWDFGDGSTDTSADPIHHFTGSGDYTVELVATRCGRSDTITQLVTIDVTIQEEILENCLPSPNPFDELINFPCLLSEEYRYRLLDPLGRRIDEGNLDDDQMIRLDSSLPRGMYLLQILWDNGARTYRIFKK